MVRPGERIAADGAVTFGESAVDRAMMTGESVPADAATGDEVTGGTIALTGRLVVRAVKVAGHPAGHLIALVEQAQAGKAASSGWPTGSAQSSSRPSWPARPSPWPAGC